VRNEYPGYDFLFFGVQLLIIMDQFVPLLKDSLCLHTRTDIRAATSVTYPVRRLVTKIFHTLMSVGNTSVEC
jgi:hypothetical protein